MRLITDRWEVHIHFVELTFGHETSYGWRSSSQASVAWAKNHELCCSQHFLWDRNVFQSSVLFPQCGWEGSYSKVTLLISAKCCVFFPHGISRVLKESRGYQAVKSALSAKLSDSISPHLDNHWIQVFHGTKEPLLFWFVLYWDNTLARRFLIRSLLNYSNLPVEKKQLRF